MKFIKLLIIVLFLSTNALSNTIYYLLKIPNLEIIDIENNNSIRTFKAKKYFKVGIKDNNVECFSPSNLLVKEKQKLIRESINLYSSAFLNKINLRFIVLCKDLEVASIPALGVPNHPLKTIIVNINTNDYKLSRTIHHEIFHIIHDTYKSMFNETTWKKFNKENFKYSECSTCSNRLGLDLYEKTNGFLTEYSKSIASEDMAEVYSFIITDNTKIEKKIKLDPVLLNKVKYIKTRIEKIKNF